MTTKCYRTELSKTELVDLMKGLVSEWGTIMDKFCLFALDENGNKYEATIQDGFSIPLKDRKSYLAVSKDKNEVYTFLSLANMRVRLMAKITATSV